MIRAVLGTTVRGLRIESSFRGVCEKKIRDQNIRPAIELRIWFKHEVLKIRPIRKYFHPR